MRAREELEERFDAYIRELGLLEKDLIEDEKFLMSIHGVDNFDTESYNKRANRYHYLRNVVDEYRWLLGLTDMGVYNHAME